MPHPARRVIRLAVAALAAALAASAAAAQSTERTVRVLGQTGGAEPIRFVLDGVERSGDEPLRSDVRAWYAALAPGVGMGEVSGACVESRCALSGRLDDGTDVTLTGDLTRASTGRLLRKSAYGEAEPEREVAYTPLAGEVPGVGALAPRDAITGYALAELLTWAGAPVGLMATLDDGDPSTDTERTALAVWQSQTERPATGLLTVGDLAAVRAAAEARRRESRWTSITGKGWRAGYPGALLTPVAGAPNTFRSADGKTTLTVRMDPPVDDDAWDAVVDAATEDTSEREAVSYIRSNDDMEITWKRKGATTYALFHRGEAGIARLTLDYPDEGEETWIVWHEILGRAFGLTE